MKKRILFLAATLLSNLAIAQQSLDWVNSIGADGNQEVISITTDSQGNSYSTGTFNGTVDFDPNPSNTANLNTGSIFEQDMFVVKYNANGIFQWAKHYSGSNNQFPVEIKINSNNEVVLTGHFDSDFNGQITTVTGGSADVFILKLDNSGNEIWLKHFGGTMYDYAESMDIDNNDNIFIVGSFMQTVDFDLGSGVNNITAMAGDGYILKIDNNANFVWVQQLSSGMQVDIRSVKLDNNDNCIVSGFFMGTIDFDPSASNFNLSSAPGNFSTFILKISNDDVFNWVKAIDNYMSGDTKLDVNTSNEIYLAGNFNGNLVFNLTSGTSTLNSNLQDAFVLTINNIGDFTALKQFGGADLQSINTIDYDEISNKLYIGFTNRGTIDVDPSANTISYTCSSGADDIVIVSYSSSLLYNTSFSIGSIEYDKVNDIAASSSNSFYVAGYFGMTMDFDFNAGTTNVANQGDYDGFIMKVIEAPSSTNTISTNSTLFSWCENTSHNEDISFTSNGTFNAGNQFNVYLSDEFGSFANSTLIGSVASTTSGSLTIPSTIPSGLNSGGLYRIRVESTDPFTIGSDNGTNLVCNPIPAVSITATPSSGEICIGESIILEATGATTYNWSPATDLSATNTASVTASPSNTITYSVTITNVSGCENSADFTVNVNDCTASISESSNLNLIYYPNPTNGTISIEFGEPLNVESKITVINTQGISCYSETIKASTKKSTLDLSKLSSGHYTIILSNDEGATSYPIVIID